MLTEQVAELDVGFVNMQLPPGLSITTPVGAVASEETVSVTVAEQMRETPTVPLVGHERLVKVGSGISGIATVLNMSGPLIE